MDTRERYWKMFTESGDPLAYVQYKQCGESNVIPLCTYRKKHENL